MEQIAQACQVEQSHLQGTDAGFLVETAFAAHRIHFYLEHNSMKSYISIKLQPTMKLCRWHSTFWFFITSPNCKVIMKFHYLPSDSSEKLPE